MQFVDEGFVKVRVGEWVAAVVVGDEEGALEVTDAVVGQEAARPADDDVG